MKDRYDYLIAGAGLAGLVLAERLGAAGYSVLVVEKRDHIGGNCHDRRDRHGMLYHVYGPHYFRTNSDKVRDYLSRHTAWQDAKYRVGVFTRGRHWSFPVNLNTYRQLSGRPDATPAEFQAYLDRNVVASANPANSREAMLACIGGELYELFFKGYTQKQRGRAPEELDASVCRRIPVTTAPDERYFHDEFQALPRDGYHRLFENLLAASGAELRLGTDYREVRSKVPHGHLIYTGPLDEYFDSRFGPLPYRTTRFVLEEYGPAGLAHGFRQPILQVNYPGDEPFTRTVELKHVTLQPGDHSNLVREFPSEYVPGQSLPTYPVPGPESAALAERYRQLAAAEPGVTFIGRLAQYRYLNMDQVVGAALHTFEQLTAR